MSKLVVFVKIRVDLHLIVKVPPLPPENFLVFVKSGILLIGIVVGAGVILRDLNLSDSFLSRSCVSFSTGQVSSGVRSHREGIHGPLAVTHQAASQQDLVLL